MQCLDKALVFDLQHDDIASGPDCPAVPAGIIPVNGKPSAGCFLLRKRPDQLAAK
jgi:hypothetical protein